jgi:hypothetical protein
VDAQSELNRLRKEFDERYALEEAEKKRLNKEVIAELGKIDLELEEIKRDYDENKRAVIKMIMEQILGVNVEVPKVVQQKFE